MGGGGNEELLLNRYRVSVWGDKEILAILVMAAQQWKHN